MKKPNKKILVGMSLLSAAVLGGCGLGRDNEEVQDVYGPPVEDVYENDEPMETLYGPPPDELIDEPVEELSGEEDTDEVSDSSSDTSSDTAPDTSSDSSKGAQDNATKVQGDDTSDIDAENSETKGSETVTSGMGDTDPAD